MVRNVAGKELSANCPRAIWSNGWETILPYVMAEDGTNMLEQVRFENNLPTNLIYLEQDAQWVLNMSKNVQEAENCPWIRMLNPNGLKKLELVEAIRQELGRGNVVLIRDFPGIIPVELDLTSLEEELSQLPSRDLCVHGKYLFHIRKED